MENLQPEKVFAKLSNNELIKGKIEQKGKDSNALNYLSWALAWEAVKKEYPLATYTIWRDAAGMPYTFDVNAGYMVYTSVTIEGLTHEMWLPVMDSKNKAMLSRAYTYTTQYGENTVVAATMFDINKSIMRCLAKNIAMFGLGIVLFTGEDLPESENHEGEKRTISPQSTHAPISEANKNIIISEAQGKRMYAIAKADRSVLSIVLNEFGYSSSRNVALKDYEKICKRIEEIIKEKTTTPAKAEDSVEIPF